MNKKERNYSYFTLALEKQKRNCSYFTLALEELIYHTENRLGFE